MAQSSLRKGEDNCSICLETCGQHTMSNNVGCSNHHFVHFDCFVQMACAYRHQTGGGFRLMCPLCRGRFLCGQCGTPMRRLMCINCIVLKTLRHPTPNIAYDLGALLVYYPDHDDLPALAPPTMTRWRREELIVTQHIVWALLSVLFLSWISALWPITNRKGECVWREVGAFNTVCNWLVASDRIIVEILRKFSCRNDYFMNIVVRSFKCTHWLVRILWFTVLVMATLNG